MYARMVSYSYFQCAIQFLLLILAFRTKRAISIISFHFFVLATNYLYVHVNNYNSYYSTVDILDLM